VQDVRLGRVDPGRQATAERLGAEMAEPVRTELPAPASTVALEQAEARLGTRLPPVLRRVYAEVANGGFGPGFGLMSIDAAVETCLAFRSESPGPRRSSWPQQLLPVVGRDPGFDCVDLVDGAVVGWDPEGLGEWSRPPAWRRSFAEIAPSVEQWLLDWAGSMTHAERMAELTAQAQRKALDATRAHWAAKTPEERAVYGLGDDWEQQLFGHLRR